MMIDFFSTLSWSSIFLLCFSLFLILFFEFINGFHDTANAVATVIYTQAMEPTHAVLLAGVFNFLGVLSGGLAVAYAIVNLLPVDLLTSGDSRHLMLMIFSILIGAIAWNLGTWYFGLPASSSHTLIGAIIGVGMTHALMQSGSFTDGVNWGKAVDVGLSLLVSPLFGFALAFAILFTIRKKWPRSAIHMTPFLRNGVRGKKRPPFWTRFMLITSAGAVSFAHGSNDGQKGVGLVMLALICIAPMHFLINTNVDRYQLERVYYASEQLRQYAERNNDKVASAFPREESNDAFHCQPADLAVHSANARTVIAQNHDLSNLSYDNRWLLRRTVLCMDTIAKSFAKMPHTSEYDVTYLSELRKDFALPVEYAPLWVIIAIATALGVGTMIGWKRVVKTVGEGIGRGHMTYAQGVCSQITAAISIAAANLFGLPVSTTQILSSAVAGTAVANRSGLRGATVRNILLAWLFTFPVAMALSGVLYFIMTRFL